MLLHHVVAGQRLTQDAIFDTTKTEIPSLSGGVIRITQFNKQIEAATLIVSDVEASNGILHVVDKVFPLFDSSFAQLEKQPEYGPDALDRVSLVDVVDFVNGRGVLDRVYETGATFAGCRVRAFNRMGLDYLTQTINGAQDVKTGELLNETRKDETIRDFLEYSLLDQNFVLEDIPNGYVELVRPVAGCAHMFVTKRNGQLCFNDGCVVATPDPRTYLSSNGYVSCCFSVWVLVTW